MKYGLNTLKNRTKRRENVQKYSVAIFSHEVVLNIPKFLLNFWPHLSIQHQIVNSSFALFAARLILCHNFRPEWRIFDLFIRGILTQILPEVEDLFQSGFLSYFGSSEMFFYRFKDKKRRWILIDSAVNHVVHLFASVFRRASIFTVEYFCLIFGGRERNAPCSGETVGKPPEKLALVWISVTFGPECLQNPHDTNFLKRCSASSRPLKDQLPLFS